jgi:ribosome-binding protein aMBF1 (putative translation factor)
MYLTIMVHSTQSSTYRGAKMHRGGLALALRTLPMATTLASVETREVLRCDHCSLVQYRTSNNLCRRCKRTLEVEERLLLAPQLVALPPAQAAAEAGQQVAGQVREIRRARHLSQRQLAGRMQVPRTYMVRDARSRRDEEVASILADPLLAEIASLLPRLDSLHRTLIYGQVRDMAMGRRRTA